MKNLPRFRANIFMQRGAVAGAFRTIPFKILTFEELGLPPVVSDIVDQARAASCSSTGPTGSGKTTTLASIIDKINSETAAAHPHDRGSDRVPAPAQAVARQPARGRRRHGARSRTRSRYVLRQDPDVVLVGEMRDLETIEAALTIAETGHLVLRHAAHELGGVRRSTASSTSSRRTSRPQVRAAASRSCSTASCSSSSAARERAPGRVLAMEVMVPNAAIRNLIREDKIHQIYSQMQVGQAGSRHADDDPVVVSSTSAG